MNFHITIRAECYYVPYLLRTARAWSDMSRLRVNSSQYKLAPRVIATMQSGPCFIVSYRLLNNNNYKEEY